MPRESRGQRSVARAWAAPRKRAEPSNRGTGVSTPCNCSEEINGGLLEMCSGMGTQTPAGGLFNDRLGSFSAEMIFLVGMGPSPLEIYRLVGYADSWV